MKCKGTGIKNEHIALSCFNQNGKIHRICLVGSRLSLEYMVSHVKDVLSSMKCTPLEYPGRVPRSPLTFDAAPQLHFTISGRSVRRTTN